VQAALEPTGAVARETLTWGDGFSRISSEEARVRLYLQPRQTYEYRKKGRCRLKSGSWCFEPSAFGRSPQDA